MEHPGARRGSEWAGLLCQDQSCGSGWTAGPLAQPRPRCRTDGEEKKKLKLQRKHQQSLGASRQNNNKVNDANYIKQTELNQIKSNQKRRRQVDSGGRLSIGGETGLPASVL